MDFNTSTAEDTQVEMTPEMTQEYLNKELERQKEFEKAHFHESHLRSVLKGLTWRIFGTASTIFIAYFITGKIGLAMTVGGIEFLGKILLYYLHERIWELVPKGTIRVLKKRFLGR